MLASLSALIVASFNPKWLAAPVTQLVERHKISPERLSRLKARLLSPLEALVERATRRGRPPVPPLPADESNVLKALLAVVPPEAWTYLNKQRRATLVQTQERLHREYGLPAARFCQLLGIRPRTFRRWKATATVPVPLTPVPEAAAPPQPERKNVGRFDLEVTAPGLQTVADTTRWELFGVPLSVVAAQDPGDRKAKLWESFAIEEAENAHMVVQVLTEALRDKPGAQCVVDQGTPYLATVTTEALEKLEVEHAPQKEGTPTDKATKERAFGMVKKALKPVADLTCRLAQKLPQLRRPELAKALGRLLLATYLRVYEMAPRIGGHPLHGENPETLRAIVEEQRENARAEIRSKRLTLAAIHEAYDFPGGVSKFIRAHRGHALEDIQEAERRFRTQAQEIKKKVPIHNYHRYFAAVLRDVAERGRARRANLRAAKLAYARQEKELAEDQKVAQARQWQSREHPDDHLEDGLGFVALHWRPTNQALLAGGRGYGTRFIRTALESMHRQDPTTVRDRAEARWKIWAAKNVDQPAMVNAVRTVFEELCLPGDAHPPSPWEVIADRMELPNRNRSPEQPSGLRNYPARSWG
jgi:hypothetical protein